MGHIYSTIYQGQTDPQRNLWLLKTPSVAEIQGFRSGSGVGPEFSSQLIMLKESFCKVIIQRHEPGYTNGINYRPVWAQSLIPMDMMVSG